MPRYNEVKTRQREARREAYSQVLDTYCIEADESSHYSGGEDAWLQLQGRDPIRRFCVVTYAGEYGYALARYDDLEAAQKVAVAYVSDSLYAESPEGIHDLDTGEKWVPDWSTLKWKWPA